MTQEADEMVLLGHVSGVFGVQGWVKVFSETRPVEAIGRYKRWFLGRQGQWRECKVLGFRPNGRGLVARLEGVDGRDGAQALLGQEIAVRQGDLPRTARGEYYWRDLVGCRVVNAEGVDLGTVSHLVETGANDVLVVLGERERLIPFTQGHAVCAVDIAARRIEVDWDADF